MEKKIILPKEVNAPVKKGDKAGEAVYYLNGEEIGRVDILYKEKIEKASFWDYLKKAGKRFLTG